MFLELCQKLRRRLFENRGNDLCQIPRPVSNFGSISIKRNFFETCHLTFGYAPMCLTPVPKARKHSIHTNLYG